MARRVRRWGGRPRGWPARSARVAKSTDLPGRRSQAAGGARSRGLQGQGPAPGRRSDRARTRGGLRRPCRGERPSRRRRGGRRQARACRCRAGRGEPRRRSPPRMRIGSLLSGCDGRRGNARRGGRGQQSVEPLKRVGIAPLHVIEIQQNRLPALSGADPFLRCERARNSIPL